MVSAARAAPAAAMLPNAWILQVLYGVSSKVALAVLPPVTV